MWVLQGMATRNRRVGWEMVHMVGKRRRKGVERWESGSHGHSDKDDKSRDQENWSLIRENNDEKRNAQGNW
ncbi:hypothetical protein [Cytobacillus oceanisediminis]|uniref:hypothetical protein n=1 Tax=Cytobacillus oceanisediminis TaxID=665099 RepID=UPI001C24F3F4|nr:hypothetical protein [Cytobacillus oceanisediminis]MBU8769658.1 hypothetical protein [Cytobacillus oceanisediminis]